MYDESVNGWQHERCQPFFFSSRRQAPIQGFRSGRGAEEVSYGICAACPRGFCNSFRDGKELGETSVRSGGCEPALSAEASNPRASPMRGGETTVAASRP